MRNEKRKGINYIEIHDLDEAYNFIDICGNLKVFFKFKCRSCGNYQYINWVVRHRMKCFKNFLCVKCKRRINDTAKYGVPLYTNREKAKQTTFNNLGVDNPFKLQKYQDKGIETRLKKLGVKWATQADSIKKKISKIYYDKTPEQKEEIKRKIKAKLKENHGDENYHNITKLKQTWNSKSVEEKILINDKQEETFLKKYNCRRPMQYKAFKEKCLQSNKKNHGGKFYSQTDKYKQRMIDTYGSTRVNYKYNYYGIFFDSSWELAVWIYCIDHNIPIIREPCILIYNYNNKSFKYTPDFMINGELVEIKGDQFLDKDTDKWICVFDRDLDGLYEAKRQCALANNVKILYKGDYKKYVNYVNLKYGKDYLKSFNINNSFNPSYWCYYIPYTNNIIKDYYNNSNYIKGYGISPYDIDKDSEYTVCRDSKGVSPFDIEGKM